MNFNYCCFPGTFDPITNGHLDIIKRLSKLYDKVFVTIAINSSKTPYFELKERLDMINIVIKDNNLDNIIVSYTSGLLVDFCKENNIKVICRGLRNYNDYLNEYTLYKLNNELNPEIETILLFPKNSLDFISSSFIKDLVIHNQDISKYIPISINNLIKNKFKKI